MTFEDQLNALVYFHHEKVSIKRVRELRTTILNELFQGQDGFVTVTGEDNIFKEQGKSFDAKT